MKTSSTRVGSCLTLLLVAACHSGTSPKVQLPPPTHPGTSMSFRILGLGGRPFAAHAVATGDVFVTEQDLNSSVRLDSLGHTSISIPVGLDPGDVIADRAATRVYVSNFNDGSVSIIDFSTNKVTKTVQVAPHNAYRLALANDDSRLFVTSEDGNLYTMNTGPQTVGASKLLGGALQGMTIDHAGHFLYVSATSGTIWRLDASTLAPVKSVTLSCTAQDVALSSDDTELYVACQNGNIAVLDATTLATKTSIALPSSDPFGLAITPDGAQLYVTSPTAGNLTIIDRPSRGIVQTLAVTGTPRRVAFNAHGNMAYITNEGNWVDVIQ